ncbi:MAG: alpha/beta fold hydrolase [Anaerolineales bacterium]|nr:alpha/beta fold hydrolase [Anaerolineales bacterium]MCB0014430.1 alpha/beta fold hydrolase [Anaerolineales bacterium]MCB8961623.1 alpha/beta fold hydrolase [Ardenticatenales bacterium]
MPYAPSYEVFLDRRAYLFNGGQVGCLFLHGFMGTPKSGRPLAEALARQGLTVYAPLLPGHGHHPDKLAGVTMQDWLAEATDALATISEHCQEIVIIGHSMGAVLGSYLATIHGNIRGLVLVAPPLEVPDWRLSLMPILKYVMPWLEPLKRSSLRKIAHERILDMYPEVNLNDPALQKWLEEISRMPTSALAEMSRAFKMGRNQWRRIQAPTLIIQGGQDIATTVEKSQTIFELLPAKQKDIVIFPEAGHQLLRDNSEAMKQVWQRIGRFIEAMTSARLVEEELLAEQA